MSSEEKKRHKGFGKDISPDEKAAHQFLTELRTRVATQALPYQYGTEEQALASLFNLFGEARETIKKNTGCEKFANLAIEMLNQHVRPITAKWHRLSEIGILAARDGADEFRKDLLNLQKALKDPVSRLHEMAYGHPATEEVLPGPFEGEALEELFRDSLPYGIPETDQINVMQKQLSEEGVAAIDGNIINERERETVEARREAIRAESKAELEPHEKGMDAVGLACSGGGVRSATFGLGFIQSLADKGLLKDVDFLSTVSGGGFTGSFLTTRLKKPESEKEVGGAFGPDPAPIRFLRQRAKYLTSQSLWESWGMVASTLAGMIINWLVPLTALVVLAIITVWAEGFDFWIKHEKTIYLSLILLTFVSAVAFFFSLRGEERQSKRTGWIFTLFAAILVLGAIWKALTISYYQLLGEKSFESIGQIFTSLEKATAIEIFGAGGLGIGTLGVLVPAILRFVPVLKKPKARALVNRISMIAAALFLPVVGVVTYFILCAIGKLENFPLTESHGFPLGGMGFLVTLAAFLGVLTFCFLNVNLTAPHRLYRNGLAGTFIRQEDEESDFVELSKINESKTADGETMPGFAPYHIINAAANLPNSKSPGLRERMCDFFLFSKHFTGSPVIGYRPTSEWEMNGKPADLASAMAISGAAFSSNMGLSSIRPLRALLTFLNVRLGFWIRRPQMPALIGNKGKHPGFSFLLREMAGVAMSEKQRWLNLSDGGHIENLAIYELLRRRCRFMICVDGECDPTFQFQGLVTLIRHARIDLGVRIAPDLGELRKDPKTKHSRCHFHLLRVHYPENGATGLLLYVKLSTTGNESELIQRYQGQNPDFPHQTTMDQFFDEEQFEAYRQLGAHVGDGLFAPCLTSGNTNPKSVRSWFKSLSQNLLMPE